MTSDEETAHILFTASSNAVGYLPNAENYLLEALYYQNKVIIQLLREMLDQDFT